MTASFEKAQLAAARIVTRTRRRSDLWAFDMGMKTAETPGKKCGCRGDHFSRLRATPLMVEVPRLLAGERIQGLWRVKPADRRKL